MLFNVKNPGKLIIIFDFRTLEALKNGQCICEHYDGYKRISIFKATDNNQLKHLIEYNEQKSEISLSLVPADLKSSAMEPLTLTLPPNPHKITTLQIVFPF